MSTASLDLRKNIITIQESYAGGSFSDIHQCLYHARLGSNEDVPQCVSIERPSLVAVKALRFSVQREDGTLEPRFCEAVASWKTLDHPNIVPFLGIASGFGPYTSLVSVWMSHGTLQSFLADHDKHLSIADRLYLVKDIAAGIAYLHNRKIAHGDLTGNNILLDEGCHARLADFGLLSLLRELPEGRAYGDASTKHPQGIRYIAHEVVVRSSQNYSFESTSKSDIYSFGCIMLQVLSGQQPWSEINNDITIIGHLAKLKIPSRPNGIGDAQWLFIEKCLSPSQDRRPSGEKVVQGVDCIIASLPSTSPLRDPCVDVH